MASLLDARLLYCICSVRTKKEYEDPLTYVLENGIDENLLDGVTRECFQWLLEYQEIEGRLPSVSYLSKTYNTFDFRSAKEERDNLTDLTKEYVSTKSQEILGDALDSLISRPKAASPLDLVNLLDEVKAKIPLKFRTKCDLADPDKIDELRNYKQHAVKRLDTPWPSINKVTGGYELGSLSGFVAPPGAGKTWISCINAHHFLKEGKSVGLFSMEDPEWRINFRLWSIIGGVSPTMFSDGLVGKKSIKEIEATLKGYPGKLVVYSKKDLGDVKRLERIALDAGHDVVIVDAMYLLQSGKRALSDYDNTRDVIRGLEDIAGKHDISAIVTSQYGSAGTKLRTAGFSIDDITSDGIRWGRDLDMSCAMLMGFYREPGESIGHFKILKIREAREDCQNAVVETNWRIADSNFDEVGFRTVPGQHDDFEAEY